MAQTYVPLSDEDRRWAASTHNEGVVFRGTNTPAIPPYCPLIPKLSGFKALCSRFIERCLLKHRTMRAAAALGGFDSGEPPGTGVPHIQYVMLVSWLINPPSPENQH